MMLSTDEVCVFAAMLFGAGANRTAGKQVEDLATLSPEQFREALDIARAEYPKFKAKIKEQRRRRPVS